MAFAEDVQTSEKMSLSVSCTSMSSFTLAAMEC